MTVAKNSLPPPIFPSPLQTNLQLPGEEPDLIPSNDHRPVLRTDRLQHAIAFARVIQDCIIDTIATKNRRCPTPRKLNSDTAIAQFIKCITQEAFSLTKHMYLNRHNSPTEAYNGHFTPFLHNISEQNKAVISNVLDLMERESKVPPCTSIIYFRQARVGLYRSITRRLCDLYGFSGPKSDTMYQYAELMGLISQINYDNTGFILEQHPGKNNNEDDVRQEFFIEKNALPFLLHRHIGKEDGIINNLIEENNGRYQFGLHNVILKMLCLSGAIIQAVTIFKQFREMAEQYLTCITSNTIIYQHFLELGSNDLYAHIFRADEFYTQNICGLYYCEHSHLPILKQSRRDDCLFDDKN
ncbi:hypothetical protein [Flavilitoribacter nigricans]|uniref:Uncharacterized protein n=1 Tax=Flavilitoribacter nigricans (strain ATCC 23147 / DSM 23189 / NBRC 102662 / NCIMB 1420 / SS-2) TaxID=1122177 RepID=A0A2D0NIJ9_FLAN2|nr:hypothetical protein [Flavilitoribacter nigricans]PHN08324.1 hypothetical protein CRP01_03095 [Flavilitoribacter nigricans DSM 23189 = NBRC 102662]